ncbi:MAG: caspase family protein [Bacteroidales bacterium]|nr:caspase family protein [Bacteroidales bacterium]
MKRLLLLFVAVFYVAVVFAQTGYDPSKQLVKTKSNGKYGYVDEKGKVVIPCVYDAIGEFRDAKHPVRAKRDGRWTYVDKYGNELKTRFDWAFPFYDSDLALVYEKEWEGRTNFGYVNDKGIFVIPTKYLKAYPFSNGLAAVKKHKERKYGFIDTRATEVLKPAYDDVKWGFIDGLAWVKKGNKWGMITKTGETKVNFEYSRLGKFDPETGFADAITSDGQTHFYDSKGRRYNSSDDRVRAYPNSMKPKIKWPSIPSSTSQQLLAVSFEVESDSKIDLCKVYLNNFEVGGFVPGGSFVIEDEKAKGSFNVTIDKSLTLKEGLNTISIKVRNASGETQEQRTIEYKPSKPIQEKAYIVWDNYLATTSEQRYELNATVNSTVECAGIQVFQKGEEIPSAKGSYIVEEQKNAEDFRFVIKVKRSLELEEGANEIKIVIKNSQGKVIKSEKMVVTYTPKEKRVALVIGNANYSKYPLKSPENDANAISAKLRQLGFDVMGGNNLTRSQMESMADRFEEESSHCDVALFYFSGHGSQADDVNYLIPVDFDLVQVGKEKYYGMPAVYVLERMKAKKRIVILDACRTNPTLKGQTGGLAAMNQADTYFSFAAAVKQPAIDGGEGNLSPYTEALIHALDKPNLSIDAVFREVIKEVKIKTKGFQIPYVNHSFTEDFIFNKQQ